jgi:glycine cleavage system aminomethyltransferase T
MSIAHGFRKELAVYLSAAQRHHLRLRAATAVEERSEVSEESLEAAIQRAGGAVEFLRNHPALPHTFPVKPEFSNWRSEQRAWRESAALLDQSHHMADLFVNGPDALQVFADLGVNNFSRFQPNVAKQLVCTNSDGYVIGDGILFYLAENEFDFVGAHPTIVDWVHYNALKGGYDVTIERDENSFDRQGPPKLYRYEIQGPHALDVVEKVTGAPVPEVKFFHMTEFTIAGLRVRALRHGMAGQPGFEFFGPWEDGEAVRSALLEAGEEFGMLPAGSRAYSTANLDSGWVPSPPPAIFSGEGMREFREWRKAARGGSLGGSFHSPNIEDYYVTPYDLGYGKIVAFDHDFPGRAALERIAEDPPRQKVTLVWDAEDIAGVIASQLGQERSAKFIEWPKSRYALFQTDSVLNDEGDLVGLSFDCGYIYNERAFVSLATVENEYAQEGTEVTVLWGESPNSAKPTVEPHVQVEIRATVAPAPFVSFARSAYRAG